MREIPFMQEIFLHLLLQDTHLDNLKLEEFGPELDLEDLKQYLIPLTDITDDEIKGEVLYIDEFGNCQTNISPQELTDKDYKIGDVIPIKIDNQELGAKWCENIQK